MRHWVLVLVVGLICSIGSCMSQAQCGKDAGGAVCPNGLCCSSYGFCGDTPAYCTNGCQSQCTPTPTTPTPTPTPTPTTPTPTTPTGGGGGGDLASIVPQSLFDEIFKHKNDRPACEGGFYTYDAFITASKSYGAFASEGNPDDRKREVAAFLAQTSHETTGGSDTAPDGPYAWGYCFVKEKGEPKGYYCEPSKTEWPCAPNQKYFGRGPIQLTGNVNYGQAGEAIGEPLLTNPDLVASDPVISFKTAFWFWMTAQPPKPSCHEVILGKWTPTDADKAAGRVGGFGLTINIINGGVECGKGPNNEVADRIGFYRKYCELLGVSPGDNLDCNNQMPYPS